MLSKSFALFAAFAAFSPAFAAPLPDVLGVNAAVKDIANNLKANVLTQRADAVGPASFAEVVKMLELSRRGDSSGCSVAEVDAIVNNVLNNGTIDILTQSKRSDCDVVGVTAEVKNVLNNLHISVLSQSKRGEEYCSLADVEAIVTDVANDMKINVITQSKRSGCDVVKVTAIVKDILDDLKVNVLTQSKRSTYSVSAIATKAKAILEGTASKRSQDGLANVVVVAENDIDQLTANVAKRANDVSVAAVVKNVLNNAKLTVD
jgi:hypothetical protein